MKNILKNIYNDIMHIKTFIIIFIIAFISLNLLFHKICLISIITGFPCPGCGMTRAFVNLLTFHFKDAFYWSPSIFLWIPLLIYGILNRYIFKCSNKIFTILLCITGIITIIIYIVRMITLYPDNAPMVYYENNIMHLLSYGLSHINKEINCDVERLPTVPLTSFRRNSTRNLPIPYKNI